MVTTRKEKGLARIMNNSPCTDQPEARYSNDFKMGHNAFEFLLDFGQFYPDSSEARLHTPIVTSPVYAKVCLHTLRESVDQYDESFGEISTEHGNKGVDPDPHGLERNGD